MSKYPIHIDNQTITLEDGMTTIVITHGPDSPVKLYRKELKFNLITDWRAERNELYNKNKPLYYWLAALRFQILEQIRLKINEVEYKISLLEKSFN